MDDTLRQTICQRTISSNAFYMLVMLAIKQGPSLSCVRMADGERLLLQQCREQRGLEEVTPLAGHTTAWLKRYGVVGISRGLLRANIEYAALHATHLAPSISGLLTENFNVYELFPLRDFYVDNFFVEQFTIEQKVSLFQAAGHVLLIHDNLHTADSMQLRVQANLGVKISFLKLGDWRDGVRVAKQAVMNTAPLVLYSGGPANKWIGPTIARDSLRNKAVLDLGHGADIWTMGHLPIDREQANQFHRQWIAEHSLEEKR